MKKKTKTKILKDKIVALNKLLKSEKSEKHFYENIVSDVINMLPVITGSYNDNKVQAVNVANVVQDLVAFKKGQQGAQHAFYEENKNLTEIVRWLINPETAKKPTEQQIQEWRQKGML